MCNVVNDERIARVDDQKDDKTEESCAHFPPDSLAAGSQGKHWRPDSPGVSDPRKLPWPRQIHGKPLNVKPEPAVSCLSVLKVTV